MKKYNILIIPLLVLLFFAPVAASAQTAAPAQNLTITSIAENMWSGKGVSVKGTFSPLQSVILGLYDSNNNLIYSISTISDANGNWAGNFDQPLKKGAYYVVALPGAGNILSPVRSKTINTSGPFSLIILIFSVLVVLLALAFFSGWYADKLAEIKRYRRILISERDVASFYNIIKKDIEKSLENMSGKEINEAKASETKFLLARTNENLEKMNKYITKGIETISKYDIIKNISNIFKAKS